MKLRILALTRYERLGSSSRVRFYQYFPYLESKGVEIVSAPFFKDEYVRGLYTGHKASPRNILNAYWRRVLILIHSATFDLLWVEKEFLPWLPGGFEALLRRHTIPYVVDYDDAVFHRYDMHNMAIVRMLLGNKIDKVMRQAALVIVGNEYLAERARKAGAGNVKCLPSVVDVNRYILNQHEPNPVFRIGWIGSPVTAPYLNLIREVLGILNQESEMRLILVGAGKDRPFPEIPTEMIPWSEDVELTANQKFDVGVMPLPDEPFERGKCGYKLVQYMAGGVPVVASPVGANRQIVESQINGYLADSPEDWLKALRHIREHPQSRKALGLAGREKASRLYNLSSTAPKLFELLASVAKP